MADEGTEDEVAASLARLRLFLAPHKADKTNAPQVSSDVHESTNEESLTTEEGGGTDDLSGDLSTLAEHLTSGADDDGDGDDSGANEPEPIAETIPCEVELPVASAPADPVFEQPTPASNAVATVSPISAVSKEYAQVKYLLQSSLPGFRVHDDMVMWDMKNPALIAQYDAHMSGMLELDSWVEVEKLSAAMDDKRSDQAASPNINTRKFATGNIVTDPVASKKGRKQLVLCKIAVGRSLTVESDEDARSKVLPPGYHSYYVQPKGNDVEQNYRHEYILNDALQILPQYLVRFSYSAIEAKTSHPCALCEKNSASLHCKACDAELCADCDTEVHSANKLVERHKRSPLRERAPGIQSSKRRSSSEAIDTNQGSNHSVYTCDKMSDDEVDAVVQKQVEESMSDFHATCQLHNGKRIEFYCPICTTPVCVICKMVGDHSIGEKGAHRLLPIGDAYEQCLRESFKSDPLVDARRSVIENKLNLISQWEKDIEVNREQVEVAIRQQYEQALANLKEETQKKTSVLKGEALEFLRQQQQLEWLDNCLDERRSSCSVVEFLSSWNQHKLLRAEQRDFPASSHAPLGGDQVKADLQLIGNLQVVAGDQVIPRLSFTGSEFEDLGHLDDRCALPSPRGSVGSITSPPSSVRRTSDNDIRRKLLSMRSVEKRLPESASTASPNKAPAGMGTLSPEGRKMMEEIRNDLFARRTVRSTSGSVSPLRNGSPSRPPLSVTPALRSLSIQPTLGTNMTSTIDAPLKQRARTSAWTTLLRRELATSKNS